jgi:hypothetical protein
LLKGYLFKQSRHLKKWRERYVVLTHRKLTTFKNEAKDSVTEILDMN